MTPPLTDWLATKPKCVVMCGGKSTRFVSAGMHKSMAAIAGIPLLRYVIDYWCRYADSFIFVVKNGKADVMEYVHSLPIHAEFVEPDALRGIADGLCQTEALIDAPFITVLGDCFCSGEFALSAPFGYGVGVQPHAEIAAIRRNFSVEINLGRVVRLEEKPSEPVNQLCGLGYYFFQPDIFDYIRRTARSARSGEIEITDVLQTLVNHGIALQPVMLNGVYVNVNTPDDLLRIGDLLHPGACADPLRS